MKNKMNKKQWNRKKLETTITKNKFRMHPFKPLQLNEYARERRTPQKHDKHEIKIWIWDGSLMLGKKKIE